MLEIVRAAFICFNPLKKIVGQKMIGTINKIVSSDC